MTGAWFQLVRRFIAIIFPIYSWGLAVVLLAFLLVIALIALFSDPEMALYMGVGGYLGMVINQARLGAAPEEMEIHADEIGPIATWLDSSPWLIRIGDRLWAPRRYQSWRWESDRIVITDRSDGSFRLKARRNDLKLIRERLER